MCGKNDTKSGIWWIDLPIMTVCLYSVLCVCLCYWLKTKWLLGLAMCDWFFFPSKRWYYGAGDLIISLWFKHNVGHICWVSSSVLH
jgi:hypothetical protein